MALGRKVDYPVHIILFHQRLHRFIVTDVGFYKDIILLALNVFQVGQISCIRQFVEVDDAVFRVFVHEKAYHVRTDESGTARYHYISLKFHIALFCLE